MDLESLARLVRDMRQHQRDYFRTKSGAELQASKDYEKRVDRAVKDILNPPAPGLFDAPACDHAWVLGENQWFCSKCGADMTDNPPRGKAGAVEKPPPNSGGEQ